MQNGSLQLRLAGEKPAGLAPVQPELQLLDQLPQHVYGTLAGDRQLIWLYSPQGMSSRSRVEGRWRSAPTPLAGGWLSHGGRWVVRMSSEIQ